MHLLNTDIKGSGNRDGRVRLIGEVQYDDGRTTPEIIWFEVPRHLGEYLSCSGNPWLACLLPLALTIGEPLRMTLPVDQQMLAALPKLIEIWQSWYPHLSPVEIEVSGTLSRQPKPQGKKTAAFFSGGIDSFFTVLHYPTHFERQNSISNIDDLIFIWGFDIPADRISAAAVARESVRKATDGIGKTFVEVRTNLRQTRFSETDWTGLSHGCLLAAIALALEDRYQEILISSTYSLGNLRPLGSHPFTDPLFSTTKTNIVHYGSNFSRVEKTKFLSSSDIVMRSLRVCFESLSGANCGACNKCYITLATLDLIGSIDRCTTLPTDQYTTERLSRIEIRNEAQAVYFEEIKTFAFQTNRLDIATAIDKCLRWNSHLKSSLSAPICTWAADWLKKYPLIWKLFWPLRAIFKMAVRHSFVYRAPTHDPD